MKRRKPTNCTDYLEVSSEAVVTVLLDLLLYWSYLVDVGLFAAWSESGLVGARSEAYAVWYHVLSLPKDSVWYLHRRYSEVTVPNVHTYWVQAA